MPTELLLLAAISAAGALLYRRYVTSVVVREYERAALYRKGKLDRVLDTGSYRIAGRDIEARVVDLRERREVVPGQEVLSSDHVGLRVSLAIAYRVSDPVVALHTVQDYENALYLNAQIALREAVGARPLDELLEARQTIGDLVTSELRSAAAGYGVEVVSVALRDIMLPGDLKTAYSEVARARQRGLATLERARGETAALRNLKNATGLLRDNPALWHARLLQLASEARQGTQFVVEMPGALAMGQDQTEAGSSAETDEVFEEQ